MEGPPLVVRLGLWRVTRHPLARRLHDRLADRGLFVAQLDRYERPAVRSLPEGPDPPGSVRFTVAPAVEGVPDRLRDAPVAPGDRIVRAVEDGEAVGYCCLSDRPVYVPELRRRLAFDGTYLWRLYVPPPQRGRGIGTAVIGRAVEAAASDADRIVALVAPDNVPSRAAFAGVGFRPTARFTSVGAFGRERHRHTTAESEPADQWRS